jgi:hypothetical protein
LGCARDKDDAAVKGPEMSTRFLKEDPEAGRCSTGSLSAKGGPMDDRLGICGSSLRTGNCGVSSSVLRSGETYG